ncbi:MAG: hypothetical protein P4K98_08075 [Bryobacteraceae bacterium]|nr:hypothetical protein [Bryobacteraceae bacterium]
MRSRAIGYACVALASAFAWGQDAGPQSRAFTLANGAAELQLHEIVTIITRICAIPGASLDSGKNAIKVNGTSDQIEFVKWLIGELDRPAGEPLPANSPEHRRQMPGNNSEAVQAFYADYAQTPVELQEVMTAVRVGTELRYIYPYAGRRVLVARGTASQLEIAAWLIGDLGNAATAQAPSASASHEYRLPGGDELVRLFYLSPSESPQYLQEVMIMIRVTTNMRGIFPNSTRRALVARGSAAQIAIAAWLVGELEQSAGAPSPGAKERNEYRIPGGDERVRLFYVPSSQTPQDLQEVMTMIRATTDMRDLFPNSTRRAVVARGSSAQMATAEWLVNDLEKSANASKPLPNGPHEYRVPEGSDVVRVFYMARTQTPQDLQAIMTRIHESTGIRSIFPSALRGALVVRGTPEQIASVERLIEGL